jgi:hypothetical protein
MESLGWLFLGLLAGIIVWQMRGMNLGVALLGGLFLGPLMFLFLLTRGKGSIKCPWCASWIGGEARVCPRCQRDLVPIPPETGAPTTGASKATRDDSRFMPGQR